MFSLADTTEYPDIRAWYLDQSEAILPYGVEWTFTKDSRELFKVTATFKLSTYVEREVKQKLPPNPEYKLLKCWQRKPSLPPS